MCLKHFSRCFFVNFFESLKRLVIIDLLFGLGKKHAAATTGPAQGPLPTSSTPMT